MTAKDYLRDIRRMDLEIKTLQEQIEMLRQDAECVKSMQVSDMPKGGKSRDMSDAVVDSADLQMICARYMSELTQKRKEAMDLIMQVDGSELRTILLMRYLQGLDWDDIADRTNYSLRTVFSLHGEALNEFGEILDEMSDQDKVCSKLQ